MPQVASTCPVCDGDGLKGENNEEFCDTCMGGGSLPVIGVNRYIKETTADNIDRMNDALDKLNDIELKVDEVKTVVDAL